MDIQTAFDITDLRFKIQYLTAELESVKLDVEKLKQRLVEYEKLGAGYRNEYFVLDHLASSNS